MFHKIKNLGMFNYCSTQKSEEKGN